MIGKVVDHEVFSSIYHDDDSVTDIANYDKII